MLGANRRYEKKRQAFTLVELLVAIAVACLLMSLIVGVTNKVRDRAASTVCLSNERQLALGISQYTTDNDETFPTGHYLDTEWAAQIFPYVKTLAVFTCPGDHTSVPNWLDQRKYHVGSYAMNANLGGWATIPFNNPGHSVSQRASAIPGLTQPAKTVLFFEVSNALIQLTPESQTPEDSAGVGDGSNVCSDGATHWVPCGSSARTVQVDGSFEDVPLYATGDLGGRPLNGSHGAVPRHFGGSNFVACDGHSVWLGPESVSGGRDSAAQDCNQGTSPEQPPDCLTRHPADKAAGTGSPDYRLTFSGR
jgi:prepilin-type N-terminal cleavage/methylation domain-containing protein